MSTRTIDPIHAGDRRPTPLASIADEGWRRRSSAPRTPPSCATAWTFSAALCNADGETVRAGGHGFRSISARCRNAMETLIAKWGDRMNPGDVFVMNDPFDGGIHLQDIFRVQAGVPRGRG